MINTRLIDDLKLLVYDLGKEVEKIKKSEFKIQKKVDHSPITIADNLVNEEVCNLLTKFGQKNIISEERKLTPYETRKTWKEFWLIDPIDGTKEFIQKNNDYTINLCYFSNKIPMFSLVYAPAENLLYEAYFRGGSKKNGRKILCSKKFGKSIRIVASKSHLDSKTGNFIDLLSKKMPIEIKNYGSSLKICKVAEGKADIYPRYAPTMEWDTAAADLVLREAGGCLVDAHNNELLKYNKSDLLNPYFLAHSNMDELNKLI